METIKKWIFPILMGVVLIGVLIWGASEYNTLHARLVRAQSSHIVSPLAEEGEDGTVVLRANFVEGYDKARVAADDYEAEDLCMHIFNWADYDAYMVNREWLDNSDMVSADSRLLSDIMPPLQRAKDVQGNDYWHVRDGGRGYNMAYSGMTSRVTLIDGDIYKYATVVTVTTGATYLNTDGSTTPINGTADFLLTYQTDGNNNITDVEAYALP